MAPQRKVIRLARADMNQKLASNIKTAADAGMEVLKNWDQVNADAHAAASIRDLSLRAANNEAAAPALSGVSRFLTAAGGTSGVLGAVMGAHPLTALGGAGARFVAGKLNEAVAAHLPSALGRLAGGIGNFARGPLGTALASPQIGATLGRAGQVAGLAGSGYSAAQGLQQPPGSSDPSGLYSPTAWAARLIHEAGKDGALASLTNQTGKLIQAGRQRMLYDPTFTTNPVEDSAISILDNPERAASLSRIQLHINDTMNRIDSGAKALINGSVQGHSSPASGIGPDLKKSSDAQLRLYNDRLQFLNQLKSDPRILSSMLQGQTDGWGKHAPNVAEAMNAQSMRAISFLLGKAPSTLTAPLVRNDPSPAEVARFNRYWDAIDRPVDSILRQGAAGTIPNESMEAVGAVHPELLQAMRSKVMEHATTKKTIPYQQRQMVYSMTGADLDGSQAPNMVLSARNLYAARSGPAVNPAPPPGSAQSRAGAGKMKMAQRARTDIEAAAARDSTKES